MSTLKNNRLRCSTIALFCLLLFSTVSEAQQRSIPEPLLPWKDWVTWDQTTLDCPTLFSSAEQPICFWPTTLELTVEQDGGKWNTTVEVFADSWVALPGSKTIWPVQVRAGEEALVVLQRDDRPAVRLSRGQYQLSGEFQWQEMPQRIDIPKTIGILSLSIQGTTVPIPQWDANGQLWLKRTSTEIAGRDMLGMKVYRLIEDGIPVWLRTQIELTVSGKSREELLGFALPKDWLLANVESQIPVAVDERGFVKAQVRAGQWTINLNAFRTTDPDTIEYAEGTERIVDSELVGLKSAADLRVSQIEDLPMVDATQTTFPDSWRVGPVYRWDNRQPFRLVEKMRGMGEKQPDGLSITRRLWLNETGTQFTYQDHLKGKRQRIWRLDVAPSHQIGSVKVDGEAQLITENPETGASGVELRQRDLNVRAVGRLDRDDSIAATGWQTDADDLRVIMTLPPGWRAFAVLGADSVDGDWLTAWSLFDLFLLLIFSLAVFRLYGLVPGLVALLAFGLAYHEPGAPRFTWLLLLIPLALLKVIGEGTGKRWIHIWKNLAIGMLLLCLIPFVVIQTQSVIYPQLETTGTSYSKRSIFAWPNFHFSHSPATSDYSASFSARVQSAPAGSVESSGTFDRTRADVQNLSYDPKGRIQAGPAEPQWSWNNVMCVWQGPVTAEQTIRPILISLSQHRLLTVVRIGLLVLLAILLFRARRFEWSQAARKTGIATTAIFLSMLLPSIASAQMPDQAMLDTLRERLLAAPDVYPNAAEIPTVELTIRDGKLQMEMVVHAAAEVAVPLPGRLPTWSPIAVTTDGQSDVLLSRRDGYLWLVVPKGVHQVQIEGLLPDQANWEWTSLLKPRHATVNAEGWKVTGISPDGVPDAQVFFVKEQETSDEEAAYDRSNFHSIVVVDRNLELGLVWKLRTTVTRLSEPGKAISLTIPLITGEQVVSSGAQAEDGAVAVRIGASQQQFAWESELVPVEQMTLSAAVTEQWVESWRLSISPIWNVDFSGLAAIFEADAERLSPVWHPWPGEQVTLYFSQPAAVLGETITVRAVQHQTSIGDRRRTNDLTLELESTLAGDFPITLDPEAEISSLTINEKLIPVRREGSSIIIPVTAGPQTVAVQWRSSETLGTVVRKGKVELPVEASNVTTTIQVPENRWILWADGPLRGPAIRFWTVLVVALLAALALGGLALSPLRRWQWGLLVIGLTQVHLIPSLIVIGWLFLLAWRGEKEQGRLGRWRFNLLQLTVAMTTFIAILILMFAVGAGLLGSPEMFILGNGSYYNQLSWFEPIVESALPVPYVISVSVWFYRLLMLFWALWLASSLLRWLTWGWKQFSQDGLWR